jgi:hypothetical protein
MGAIPCGSNHNIHGTGDIRGGNQACLVTMVDHGNRQATVVLI